MSTVLPLRILAASSVAATSVITATPALAQQMGYEQRVYEYAQPAPQAPAQPVYVRQPVVQPLPQQPTYPTGYEAYEVDYEQAAPVAPVQQVYQQPAPQQPVYQAPPHHQANYQPPAYPQPMHQNGYAAQTGYPPMPPVIDRKAWISECRAYLRERRRRADTGAVAGGVLGAAAGAVIGNEVANVGDKLGGALIGGGVGGLVGLFIGQAIALAGGDGTKKDCKRWLRTYEESYASGGGQWPYPTYPQQGGQYYGGGNWNGGWQQQSWNSSWHSGWSGGYIVVPQTTVTVYHSAPMVPVVREVVTEEWVETEVVHKKAKPHYKPAPKVRYIKQKPVKRIKYIKGK